MRERFEDFYSEEELSEKVEMLNAFGTGWRPWQLTTANKGYEDLFGDKIRSGESYYRVQYRQEFDAVLQLSRLSMARMCWALFESTSRLEPIAKGILGREEEQARQALLRLPIPAVSPPEQVSATNQILPEAKPPSVE